jgi:uncharacterized membrane protein SirB2
VALIVAGVVFQVFRALFIGAGQGAWYAPILPLLVIGIAFGAAALVGKAFKEEPPQR